MASTSGRRRSVAADRARVPHFGLDLVDPDQPFSVADFATHARAVLADLARDGRAGDPRRRHRSLPARRRARSRHRRPAKRSRRPRPARGGTDRRRPVGVGGATRRPCPGSGGRRRHAQPAAGRSRPRDRRAPRRRATAARSTAIRARSPGSASTVDPQAHATRIAARARAQFDAGLIEEARALRDRFDPGLPAFSAIGYREAWAVLDGELTRDAAIDLDAQRNLAFSKRQRTWFRSEPDITWLDATVGLPTETALELVSPLL